MKRLKPFLTRLTLIFAALVLAIMNSGVPVIAAPDPEGPPNLHYYTQNGIYFYEDGYLHCGSGAAVTGGAAAILEAQSNLDREWIPVILTEASAAGADPIAMASLLFWEHRGFPEYGAGPAPGESDSIGRGPWQITSGTWRPAYGDYRTAVYDPVASTKLAAVLVKEWGGVAGSPIGSIDQDFSRGSNIPSLATLAKNYNAGKYTWREPAVATYKQPGRTWLAPDKNWNNVPVGNITKADVIDDYILGMTFAYYTMATKTGQLTDINTREFVQTALANADKIKGFTFGQGGTQSGSNVSNPCGSSVANGSIVDTAFYLAWPNRNYNNNDAKSYAKDTYQEIMPQVQGQGTANSVNRTSRCPGCTAWTDCGVFVATTIRYSGADPDYEKRTTSVQLPYLRRNSDPNDPDRKFDLYENTSKDDLGVLIQPGDIFIVSGRGNNGGIVGHTYIYTGPYKGDDGEDYDSLSASWGKRVPMAANAYFVQGGVQYVVAHVRQPSTPTPPPGVGDQP